MKENCVAISTKLSCRVVPKFWPSCIWCTPFFVLAYEATISQHGCLPLNVLPRQTLSVHEVNIGQVHEFIPIFSCLFVVSSSFVLRLTSYWHANFSITSLSSISWLLHIFIACVSSMLAWLLNSTVCNTTGIRWSWIFLKKSSWTICPYIEAGNQLIDEVIKSGYHHVDMKIWFGTINAMSMRYMKISKSSRI